MKSTGLVGYCFSRNFEFDSNLKPEIMALGLRNVAPDFVIPARARQIDSCSYRSILLSHPAELTAPYVTGPAETTLVIDGLAMRGVKVAPAVATEDARIHSSIKRA